MHAKREQGRESNSLYSSQGRQDWGEKLIHAGLIAITTISVLTTIGIVIILVTESAPFFRAVPLRDFLTGTKWTPFFHPQHFGVLPLVGGTLLITLGGSLVALPLGLGAAIFLSEYAPKRLRKIIKPTLEVLAGIPSIVYGFFALTFITPVLRQIFEEVSIYNGLAASIAVGIMILPMVTSLSEDAMMAVPNSLREGAYALGSTRFEVATKVVVPSALSGIIASFILAASRAIGETMIVAIAAGSTPNLTLNPLESIQTMTGYMAQVVSGDAANGTIEYNTIFAVGLLLFVFTFVMNLMAQFARRLRRKVE